MSSISKACHQLQPIKKSFGSYITYGYQVATSRKPFPAGYQSLVESISKFDDAILIEDDILDKSELRNGKPCLYREIGIPRARKLASQLRDESIGALMLLCDRVNPQSKTQVNQLFQALENDIIHGENVNIQLSSIGYLCSTNPQEKETKYMEMVRSFTGNHIKYGLEIGQLLANGTSNRYISSIGQSCGIIRQIVDDFEDHFEGHHEPFGDFVRHSNRLPEILFQNHFSSYSGGSGSSNNNNNGDDTKGRIIKHREHILSAIQRGEHDEVRSLLLSQPIRDDLYENCQAELQNIRNYLKSIRGFDYSPLLCDFQQILYRYY